MEGQPEENLLPLGYPGADTLSDAELATAIQEMVEGWLRQLGSGDVFHLGGSVKLALIQVGVQEQQRRQIAQTLQLAEDAGRASRRASRISLAIAAIAILIAVSSAFVDYFGDRSWQNDQTRILAEIRDLLPAR